MRVALSLALLLALFAGPSFAARPVPRLAVWIEVSANLPLLASREQIAGMLDRARAAGVTDIIPEAKNAWGFVIYESAFAPHIRTSTVPRAALPAYDAPERWFPKDIDPLEVLIEEAHARGIRVHAAVNVFGEGLNAARAGILFDRPEWQAQHLGPDGRIISASEVGTIAFANPIHPEVQLYELAIIQEVASHYDVDGLVLDRIRFPDATADFSALSRQRFEEWLGRPVLFWPDDILRPNGAGRLEQGPLFLSWVAFRATMIQQFIRAAERVVHGVKPDIAFAAYVGGWYPTYWQEGVNWAAQAVLVPYPWVTTQWQGAASGDLFDFLMVGLYYPALTPQDALRAGMPTWMSIEGGSQMARQLTDPGTKAIGSLRLSLYENDPGQFSGALQLTLQVLGGAMLFDLSHIERFGWWDYIAPLARAAP